MMRREELQEMLREVNIEAANEAVKMIYDCVHKYGVIRVTSKEEEYIMAAFNEVVNNNASEPWVIDTLADAYLTSSVDELVERTRYYKSARPEIKVKIDIDIYLDKMEDKRSRWI